MNFLPHYNPCKLIAFFVMIPDVLEKTLALDSYQSNKLLDEHDLNDVLNRIPDEAFDILSGGFPGGCLFLITLLNLVNILRQRQTGCHIVDDLLKSIFFN